VEKVGAGRGKRLPVRRIDREKLGRLVAVLLLCAAPVLLWCLTSDGSARTQQEPPESEYYQDEGGWFSDREEVERGMAAFYQATGVRPYLILLRNGSVTSPEELTAMAEERYGLLFSDEDHFLLVFCDNGSGAYNCGYTVGARAKAVMDGEAVGILAEYLERHYNDLAISEEEIFSKTFADTAARIAPHG